MGIIFYYFSIKFINPNKYSKAQLIVFNKGKICRSLKHSQASNSRGSWCCRWHRRRGRRPPCRVSRAPWTNTCNMFDKYMLQLWQIYVTTLTNICDNFDKNLCLHHHCVQRRSNRLRKTRTVVVPAEVDPWTIASWYLEVIFMWLINTLVDGCVTDLVVISPDVGWTLLVQRHGHGDQ